MTDMLSFALQVLLTLMQLVIGFYGFWFTWRVLLPVLPGPENPDERIATFAGYFTDPFVSRLSRLFRLNTWLASLIGLLSIALLNIGVVMLKDLV